ncbi:MAG: LAGLIDADG family homing endonuclease [Nitrososphaeria archaeon]
MPIITPDYILGFVEGQGNFSIISSHNRFYPKFVVTSKSQSMIKQIQSFFGVGKVSIIQPKKASHNVIFVYSVTKYEEVKVIIDFFTKHSPIVKAKEFQKFKECFDRWRPKFIKRKREEGMKSLNDAIKMYKEGVPIKEIIKSTRVDLKKFYSVLNIYGVRRYKKPSKGGYRHGL